MRCTLNHNDAEKALREVIASQIAKLNDATSDGNGVVLATAGGIIHIISCLLTEDRPHVAYTDWMELCGSERDVFPAEFQAWAAAGYAEENGTSPRDSFTPSGWAKVKEFFK